MPKNLYYLNALFDLELGNLPTASVEKSAAEMSPLMALLGNQEDRVLLDVDVPREYWDYLSANGIDRALPLEPGRPASGYWAVPWGWNERSLARLAALGATCDHPDLSVVKAANSRTFCAAFNQQTGTGVPGTCFCPTRNGFEHAAGLLAKRFPLVAKPAFGGSGHGFVRINEGTLSDSAVVKQVHRLLDSGGCTLEPWCDRMHDVSTSCEIGNHGGVSNLRHYRCQINSHGTFCGVLLAADDPTVQTYRRELELAAQKAVQALHAGGYFGPVSFDSFVYRDAASGTGRLAPIIEINARHVMSAIAFALFEKANPGQCSLFTFSSRKKIPLPETYDEFHSIIGPLRYNPQQKKGVVLLSPLRVRHKSGWQQPARNAFCILAENGMAANEMELQVRQRFK
jgi:hypothetical protein